jgi:hypothetical protein
MLEPRRTCADRDACAYGPWHGLCGLVRTLQTDHETVMGPLCLWLPRDADTRTSDCAAERRRRERWTSLYGDRRRQLWTRESLTSLLSGVGVHAGTGLCGRRRQQCLWSVGICWRCRVA